MLAPASEEVSDERLRDLERRVQESPGDFTLGHELVTALERAGERRRATDELRRLLRAGDALARRRLERRLPTLSYDWAWGPRAGLADAKAARARRSFFPLARSIEIAGVTDDTILVQDENVTVGLDAATFAPLWSTPHTDARGVSAVTADRLIMRTGDARLVFMDARTGTRLKVLGAGRWYGMSVAVDDDDVVIFGLDSEGPFLEAFDLETGELLWERRAEHAQLTVCPGGGLVAVLGAGDERSHPDTLIEVRASRTGEVVWRRTLGPAVPSLQFALDGLDAVGVVRADALVAFDRATGEPLTARRSETAALSDRWDSLLLLGAGAAKPVWRAPLEPSVVVRSRIAGKHVWVVQKPTEDERSLVLSAFDRASGALVRREAVPLPSGRMADLGLAPLDGAILVLAAVEGGLLVHRLEEG
jgi:outer membrane protein assembly factor BamB